MNKKTLFLILLGVLILPAIVLASNLGNYGTVIDYTDIVDQIGTAAWIIFGGVAIVMFVISGILFLSSQGDPEKLKTARSALIWGVVGVAVAILAYSVKTIISVALS